MSRKTKSIRKRIFMVLWTIALSFLAFHLIMLYHNYMMVRRLNHVMEEQLEYSAYSERLDRVQDEVTAYFNGNKRTDKESVQNACDDFETYVQALMDFFVHPQFTDNYHIVSKYLGTVRSFLEEYPGSNPSQQLAGYNQTAHMYYIVKRSYGTTMEFEQEIVNKLLGDNTKHWRNNEIIILMLSAFVFLLSLLFGSQVINAITKPILSLTDRSRHILKKEYSYASAQASDGMQCLETEILTDAYDEMVETILNQMDRLKEQYDMSQQLHRLEVEHMQTQMALQQTEVCLMQSLISPHFLFNCMSTLSSVAFIENAPQTENCAISLAGYLREFLDRIGKNVMIREEVEHTQKYIDIQKLRFGNRIEFIMDYEPEVADIQVPALILQPIVENSLLHGLRNRRKEGRISVNIRQESEKVVVEVSDNGEGVSVEDITRVEADMNKPFKSGEKGIGLRSVYYRLNDYFHGRASLHLINDGSGSVTKIEISRSLN